MRILLLFLFLLFPLLVSAQPVLINEIAWMGTPTTGVEEKQWWRYEWLELRSTTVGTVVLDGWTLELYRDPSTDSTSSPQANSGQANLDFKVPLSGTISADGYFLIGASDKIPNLDLNYKNLGGKFNNSGQRVVLKNASGEIVDEVDARNGWLAGDNKTKQTMERVVGVVVSDPTTLWQTSAEAGGTPKAPNSKGHQPSLKKVESISYSNNISLKKGNPSINSGQAEKDQPAGEAGLSRSFQSRVPIINPITLLAGFLALGFSGVLLALKRFLALRQRSSTEAHSNPLRT